MIYIVIYNMSNIFRIFYDFFIDSATRTKYNFLTSMIDAASHLAKIRNTLMNTNVHTHTFTLRHHVVLCDTICAE